MKFSLPHCRKTVHQHLRPLLAQFNFKSKAQSYFRPSPLGTDILRFPDRRDINGCYFMMRLGISIQAVEEIISPSSKAPSATIFLPLHFLHPGQRFFEWKMTSIDDAPLVAQAVMQEMKSYGLPFFEKYPDRQAVKNTLRSKEGRQTGVSMTFDQIACVLATLEYLDGQIDEAFNVLEEAIALEDSRPIPRHQSMKKFLAELSRDSFSESESSGFK